MIYNLLKYRIIYTFIFFILGMNVGSFLNVCSLRIPKGESIATWDSYCPKCGYILKWYDLIPIFSYLVLNGKCRECKHTISKQYLLIEIITGFVWAGWFYMQFGCRDILVWSLLLIMFNILIVISIIDVHTFKISPKATQGIALISFIIAFRSNIHLGITILGCGLIFIFFIILDRIYPKSIGGGDIKLLLALTLAYGFMAMQYVLLIACVVALIRSVIVKKVKIPFVPYITLGIICYSLFFTL